MRLYRSEMNVLHLGKYNTSYQNSTEVVSMLGGLPAIAGVYYSTLLPTFGTNAQQMP